MLLLLGLLTIFPAPVLLLWYVAILVSEFSWIFIGVLVLSLLWGLRVDQYQLAGTIIACIAICLYMVPIVQAYRISTKLNGEMNAAFPRNNDNYKSAFSFWTMLKLSSEKKGYSVITYKKSAGDNLTLDYYSSTVKGKRPCAIVVHGGSWKGGDSQQLPELNSYLAKLGYNVASVNYRLAPMYNSPAQYNDVKDAVMYLRNHSDELGIDTENLVLLGRSAGGQMALLAAYSLHDMGIKGVISYYGPADMVWGYQNPANPWVYNSCQVLEDYIGGTYDQMPQKYSESSPIEALDEQGVPTLIIHGQTDVLVAYGHSTRLEAKLKELNIPHYLLTLPWATHGFDYNINGPGGQISRYAVAQFLQSITR